MERDKRVIIKKKELLVNQDIDYKETVLITGGNSGIGLSFIKLSLKEHYKVIFTVRSKEKGDATIEKLKEEFDTSHLSYMLLDLSNLDSVNSFVNEIISSKLDIHHFYHNAGIYRIPFRMIEGLEINFLTNYFAPFIITERLSAYFLTLSHRVHTNFIYSLTTYYYRYSPKKFNIDHQIGKLDTYAQTKHAIIHMYTYFLNKYKNTNLIFTISHPGATYTPLITKGYKAGRAFQKAAMLFMKMVFHSPDKAAYTYRVSLRMNKEGYYIAPRGLLEFSGYPKMKKLKNKYIKHHQETINMTKELLKGYLD